MPDSYFELPYHYVYDAQGLTDGDSQDNLSVPMNDDSEFLLMGVSGIPDVIDRSVSTSGVLLYDSQGRLATNGPVDQDGVLVVNPAIRYPVGGQIRFGIRNILRTFIQYPLSAPGVGHYRAKLVFHGVKVYRGSAADQMLRHWTGGGPHYRVPFTIVERFNLNVRSLEAPAFTQPTAPVRISFSVTNYDFELLALTYDSSLEDKVELTMRDQFGRMLSSDFVPSRYLLWSPNRPYTIFPVRPLLFEVGSVVNIDVLSRLTDNDSLPYNYAIVFYGARRLKC